MAWGCVRRSGVYACARTIIDGLGHTTWSATVPVSRSRTPLTIETFGEKISAEACSGKEIAGLLRKMIMMMINVMTRKL